MTLINQTNKINDTFMFYETLLYCKKYCLNPNVEFPQKITQ